MNVDLGAVPGTPRVLARQEREALKDIRTFSILAIVGFAIDTATVIVSYVMLAALIRGLSNYTQLFTSLTGTLLVLAFLSVGAAVLLLISFVFLRSGYRNLKGISERFRTPYTGINLYFWGLVVILIGALVILGGALAHLVGLILGAVAIILAGGIMGFIGEILGLILGSFKLKDHFNKSDFSTAGILFIVGIFFPLFNLIAAILVYRGTTALEREHASQGTYSPP